MAVDASLAGRTFPPTEPYTVSREKILEFARATGSEYDGRSAPGTFPIVIAFTAMHALMEDPGVGIALHYAALAGLVTALLWLVVPRAIDQVSSLRGRLGGSLGRVSGRLHRHQ